MEHALRVSVNGEQDFVSGQLVSQEVSMRLETMARDLVVYGRLIKEQFIHDLESNEPYTFAAHYRTLLKPARYITKQLYHLLAI